MTKFAHNKSTTQVSLLNGKILLAIGGKAPVTDQEAIHEDVVHAVRAGWIKIEGEDSATDAPEAFSAPTIAVDPMKGSATIPTLATKDDAAVSSTIGAGTGEVAAEDVASAKPAKAGSKAKAA